MKNIVEYIKDLLPTSIPLYLKEIPLDKYGMLIEETGINGRVDSFDGYNGVIQSTIQLYIRTAKGQDSYIENTKLLKSNYKTIQKSRGKQVDCIRLIWVGGFNLSSFKDNKNNQCYSIMFPVIYKEMESDS